MSRLPVQQFELYHQLMMPLLNIEPILESADHNIIKNQARMALAFTQGMRDILDDLTFDYDVFEHLLFELDDNYEVVKAECMTVENSDLKFIVNQLMTQMVKLQMEISDKLVDFKHANRA
ncbi:MAG: hypothetical protein ACXWB0_07625 [Sulfuricurvum sp.]